MSPCKTIFLENGSHLFNITGESSSPFGFMTQQKLGFKQHNWRAEWNVWFTCCGRKHPFLLFPCSSAEWGLHSLQISQAEVWRPPRWSYSKYPPCDPTYILCGQADGSLASEWPLRTLTSSVPCLSLAGQQHQIGLFFAELQIQNCILCSELWFTKVWFNKVICYFRCVTTKI